MCNLYSSTMPRQAMLDMFRATDPGNELGNAEPLPAIYPKGLAPIVIQNEGWQIARSH